MENALIPVIGIPCLTVPRQGDGRPVYGNNPAYIDAVVAAGGAPLLIPPLDARVLDIIYAHLDGLLLSGGPDVDPREFGEEPIAECGEPDRPRDALELTLAKRAVADELPVLGICRGLQVLNVAMGGTLYQDIPSQVPEAAAHQYVPGNPRDLRAHSVRVRPETLLASALGTTEHQVNSLHHQSIARPGERIQVVAQAPDGIAEGIEIPGHPFALAVQFHPEELAPTDEASQRLFAAFVRACAERMRVREEVSAR